MYASGYVYFASFHLTDIAWRVSHLGSGSANSAAACYVAWP